VQGNESPNPGRDGTQATELIRRRWLSDSVFELELSRPQSFTFKAGHTIQLFHENISRYYSLVSSPGDPTLRICLNHIKLGAFTPMLASAKTGTRFTFTGPHGYFNFSPSPRPPVFIATDTGIAPFVSMARSGIKGFTLLQGAHYSKGLYYQDQVRPCAERYLECVWDTPDEPASSELFHARMVALLVEHLKKGSYDFYLCGWQQMIRDVTRLIDHRFSDSRLYIEVFYS